MFFSGSILDFFNEAEPSPRFFQLFQANFQLVNEVFTRLGCFYFNRDCHMAKSGSEEFARRDG